MIRELTAAVPHAIGDVNVVVIDARVDESNDNAIAGITRTIIIPNGRCVDFVNMPCIGFCSGRVRFFVNGHHRTHLIWDNQGNIFAFSELRNDFVACCTTKAIERPECFDIAYQVFVLVTFEKINYLGLRSLAKRLSFGNDKVATLLLGHECSLLG